MAGTPATSNSNIQVSVDVQFQADGLRTEIDSFLKSIEEQLKRQANTRTIQLTLSNLRLNKGSAKSILSNDVKAIQKSLESQLSTLKASVKKVNIAIDPNAIDTQGIAKQVGDSISKAFENIPITLSGKGLKPDAFLKAVKKQIKQLTQQMQVAAKQTMATAGASQIEASSIFTQKNKVRKNTSFAEYRAYMLQEAKEIEAANKQVEAAIKKFKSIDPTTFTSNQQKQQYIQAEQNLKNLKKMYDARVALFEKRGRAGAAAFGGEDLTAINQAIQQARTAASGATVEYNQMQKGIGNINSTAKSAKDAINLLNNALNNAKAAKAGFDKAMNDKSLTSSQRKQLIADSQAAQRRAQQGLDTYQNQYLNTGVLAGASKKDSATLKNLFSDAKNAAKDAGSSWGTYEKHINKIISGYDKLKERIATTKQSLKGFADNGSQEALNAIAKLDRVSQLIDRYKTNGTYSLTGQKTLSNIVDQQAEVKKLLTTDQTTASKDIVAKAKEVKKAYNEVTEAAKGMAKTPIGSTQFNDLKNQMEAALQEALRLEAQLNRLRQVASTKGFTLTDKATNQIRVAENAKDSAIKATGGYSNNDIKMLTQWSNAYTKLEAKQAKYANEVAKLGSMKVDTTAYNNQFKLVEGIQKGLTNAQAKFQELVNTGKVNMQMPGMKQLIADLQALGIQLQTTSVQAKNFGPDTMRSFESLKQLLNQVNSFRSGLTSKQQATSGAQIEQFARQIQQQINAGPSADTTRIAGQMQSQWDSLRTSIANAGKESLTFGQNMSNAFKQFSSYFSVTIMVMEVIQQLKQMIEYTKQLDTAMTELRKVTDLSENTYSTFLDTAGQKAVELGSTLTDVVTTVGDFSRLGYNLDEALQLGEAAIKLKNVGDGIDSISDASEKIISAMKGFNLPASSASDIIDKYNEVGRYTCPYMYFVGL